MDWRLSEEQLAIKRMVAEFAQGAGRARLQARDRGAVPRGWPNWRPGPARPDGAGRATAAAELSYFDALLAVEEMARWDFRSAAEMHTNGTGTASHLWSRHPTSNRSAGCGRSAKAACAALIVSEARRPAPPRPS